MSLNSERSTFNAEEVKKFSKLADKWWDIHGEFAILHEINPCRLGFIIAQIESNFGKSTSTSKLKGIQILDIGCGGGLISVPLARIGASVTALDASEENIKTLEAYVKANSVELDARVGLVENFSQNDQKFDVVLALEIIEHVDNPELFVSSLAKLVKPNGLVILSTINKNLKSLALAKIGAEYILNWAPIGTHDWRKFITPNDLSSFVQSTGLSVSEIAGMTFSPFSAERWQISNDTSINYFLCAKKEARY